MVACGVSQKKECAAKAGVGTVPEPEFLAMIDESYRLVVKGLTRKQREGLGALV